MKKYTYNDIDYELTKDYKGGFDNQEVQEKLTDYFIEYDYILVDYDLFNPFWISFIYKAFRKLRSCIFLIKIAKK